MVTLYGNDVLKIGVEVFLSKMKKMIFVHDKVKESVIIDEKLCL